jgi:uncharacterized membrane protein
MAIRPLGVTVHHSSLPVRHLTVKFEPIVGPETGWSQYWLAPFRTLDLPFVREPESLHFTPPTKHRIRVAVTASIGVCGGIVASPFIIWEAAILICWDVTVVGLLTWIWLALWTLDANETESHASREDPSVRLSEAIVLSSGVALLTAVGLVLIRAGNAVGGTKAYLIALGVVSVALSWILVHGVHAPLRAELLLEANRRDSDRSKGVDWKCLAFYNEGSVRTACAAHYRL